MCCTVHGCSRSNKIDVCEPSCVEFSADEALHFQGCRTLRKISFDLDVVLVHCDGLAWNKRALRCLPIAWESRSSH